MTDIEVARYALRTFRYLGDQFRPVTVRETPEGNVWANGTCEAQCYERSYELNRGRCVWVHNTEPHRGPAPQLDCKCGIYGALSLDVLRNGWTSQTRVIVAVMAAEGQTIIGTRGLRTQFARIVAYVVAPLYRRSAARQFVGAQEFTRIAKMLQAYNLPHIGTDGTKVRGCGPEYWNENGALV